MFVDRISIESFHAAPVQGTFVKCLSHWRPAASNNAVNRRYERRSIGVEIRYFMDDRSAALTVKSHDANVDVAHRVQNNLRRRLHNTDTRLLNDHRIVAA